MSEANVTARLGTPRRRRIFAVLCWVLAASFLMGAITKFMPGETFFGPPYSEKFVEWGYPAWFRFVVGGGELVGAVLLVLPRWRLLGAGLLLVILEGAVVTHIVNSDPLAESIFAPVVLVLTALVAWVSAPWSWRGLWNDRRSDRQAAAHPSQASS